MWFPYDHDSDCFHMSPTDRGHVVEVSPTVRIIWKPGFTLRLCGDVLNFGAMFLHSFIHFIYLRRVALRQKPFFKGPSDKNVNYKNTK